MNLSNVPEHKSFAATIGIPAIGGAFLLEFRNVSNVGQRLETRILSVKRKLKMTIQEVKAAMIKRLDEFSSVASVIGPRITCLIAMARAYVEQECPECGDLGGFQIEARAFSFPAEFRAVPSGESSATKCDCDRPTKLREFARALGIEVERDTLSNSSLCTRDRGHSGPCNGFPRSNCAGFDAAISALESK